MANTIPQAQNEPQQLGRLAAQRCIYTRAKRVVVAQLVVTMISPLVAAGLVAAWIELKGWVVFVGVLIAVVDALFLDRWQKHLKQHAARIQELFDTEVLDLPWHDVKVGQQPDVEDVIAACRPLKKKDPSYKAFRDWYPPAVGALPFHLARIVCQRANCRWDAMLRKRYRAAVLTGLVLLIISVVFIGFVGGMTIDKVFVAMAAPLLPSILWTIRETRSQSETADALDKLKGHLQTLWDGAHQGRISPSKVLTQSRDIQDEIYDRRRLTPLIFDWIYNLLRARQEEEMTMSADQMVEQYLQFNPPQNKI